jgi:hypothetical protein
MTTKQNTSVTRYNACKLTDHQVYMILTSPHLTTRQLANMMGVSFSTIQKVRQNAVYKHVHPDISRNRKRAVGPRCAECVHYFKGACSLSFPEHKANGGVAAVHCAAYARERVL